MTETKVPSSPRRRAFFIGALVLVVVALVATLAATWWIPAYRVSAARAAWQPPPDAVLSASMRERPVPGWHANPADSGLPRSPGSRFAVSDVPFGPRPFVGSIGSDAYFLALSGSDDEPQWWLIGIDVRSGQKLFDAVPLHSSASPPKCFLNGPNDVLCLSDGAPAASAWVIDRHSGMTRYQGPTDLRLGYGTLVVEQVGIYAVAHTQDVGAFGIGPQGETTWFVPGNGRLAIESSTPQRNRSQTLTAQLEADPRTYVSTVFSVADGSVIEPEIDDGYTLGGTAFYTGGFAAEVDDPEGRSVEIAFFDEAGRRVGGHAESGVLSDGDVDLPVVSSEPDDEKIVFSANGDKLFETRYGALALVDTTLMVNMTDSHSFPEWQQYNMRDGTAGPVCDFPMDDYLGHHESTLVFQFSQVSGDVFMVARDLNSCERLWSIPKEAKSLERVWLIDGTLVQLKDRGAELISLVAPT